MESDDEEGQDEKQPVKLIRQMAEFQKYEISLQEGCQKDFEKLLLNYEEKRNFSFPSFSEIWKDMNMNLMFAGLVHADDIGKFTEICMFVATKLFIYPKNIHTQVGAFYLLYALYFMQPFKHFVKIRLTHREFQELSKLVERMKDEGQNDFLFVYGKLRMEKAFEFVATVTPIAISYNFLNQLEVTNDTFVMEQADFYDRVHGTLKDYLDDLSETHRKYQMGMEQFSEKYPELGVTVFKSNLIEDLEELASVASNSSQRETREPVFVTREVAKRRREIRNRAVALINDLHKDKVRKGFEMAKRKGRKGKDS